jgi:hypothetical protein
MGARSTGREAALQMLFSLESGGSIERVISHYWRLTPGDPEGREYADGLARGIANEIDRIDSMIRKASVNWRLERMARVDRNILRWALGNCFIVQIFRARSLSMKVSSSQKSLARKNRRRSSMASWIALRTIWAASIKMRKRIRVKVRGDNHHVSVAEGSHLLLEPLSPKLA